MVKKTLFPLVLVLLLTSGCGSEADPDETTNSNDAARYDPAVEKEIEAAVDGFFGELFLLHEPETKSYVDLEAVGAEEWEEYWDRLETYGLEIGSVTLLNVEPPTDSDPPTAYIGVDADLLVDGERVSVEAYRLPVLLTPDGWRLTELPFAE